MAAAAPTDGSQPPILSAWHKVLTSETVPTPVLRRLAMAGCPEDYRAVAWMVLFGVVGKKPARWDADVSQQVEGYTGFATEFIDKAFMDEKAVGSTVGTLIHAAVSQQPSQLAEPRLSTGDAVEAPEKTPTSESSATEGGASASSTEDGASASSTEGGASASSTEDGASASTTEGGASASSTEDGASASTTEDGASASTTEGGASAAATVVVEQTPAASDPLQSKPVPAGSSKDGSSDAATETDKAYRRKSTRKAREEANPDYDQLWEDVRKDVVRTHSNLSFFQKRASLEGMCRILYIYGKLNPGLAYVQGMNELLAPIFWVCHNCPVPAAAVAICSGKEWVAPAEPSTDIKTRTGFDITISESLAFFLFTALMAETRDLFIKRLDNSSGGINGLIVKFGTTLRRIDPFLADHLDELGIDSRFFGYRWFTTLLAREFELPDTLRLWDRLCGDSLRFSLLFYASAAMVFSIRSKLLGPPRSDFSRTLTALQDFTEHMLDVEEVVAVAIRMRTWDTRSGSGVTIVGGVPTHPDDDRLVKEAQEKQLLANGGLGRRQKPKKAAPRPSSSARAAAASGLSILGDTTSRLFGAVASGARRLSSALTAPSPGGALPRSTSTSTATPTPTPTPTPAVKAGGTSSAQTDPATAQPRPISATTAPGTSPSASNPAAVPALSASGRPAEPAAVPMATPDPGSESNPFATTTPAPAMRDPAGGTWEAEPLDT